MVVLKKYHHYKKLDPDNTEFFGYEHLINPEKYTGPLEFEYLPKKFIVVSNEKNIVGKVNYDNFGLSLGSITYTDLLLSL